MGGINRGTDKTSQQKKWEAAECTFEKKKKNPTSNKQKVNSGKHLLFHSQYHKRRTKGIYEDILVWEEKKAAWARADVKRKWTKN